MNIIKILFIVVLTGLSVYASANDLQIYDINKTVNLTEQFNSSKVNSVNNLIRNLTETPDNNLTNQNNKESINIHTYFQLYANSNTNTNALEQLSKFCINANTNNSNISFQNCLNGELHPDGKVVKNMLDSIEYHYKNTETCLDNLKLLSGDISSASFDDYINGNYTKKNIGDCNIYGNKSNGKIAVTDIPQTITKQGTGFASKRVNIENHDMFFKDCEEVDSMFCITPISERNQVLNDYIADDCERIESIEAASYNYMRYCASYFNHYIDHKAFAATTSDSTRDAFGWSSVEWDGCKDKHLGVCFGDHVWGDNSPYNYVKGNTYNKQNIKLYATGGYSSNSAGTVYFRLPNPDYTEAESSGMPKFKNIPEQYTLNSVGKEIIQLYKTYFDESKNYQCANISIQKEVGVELLAKESPNTNNGFLGTYNNFAFENEGVDSQYILNIKSNDALRKHTRTETEQVPNPDYNEGYCGWMSCDEPQYIDVTTKYYTYYGLKNNIGTPNKTINYPSCSIQ